MSLCTKAFPIGGPVTPASDVRKESSALEGTEICRIPSMKVIGGANGFQVLDYL